MDGEIQHSRGAVVICSAQIISGISWASKVPGRQQRGGTHKILTGARSERLSCSRNRQPCWPQQTPGFKSVLGKMGGKQEVSAGCCVEAVLGKRKSQ